MPQIWLIVGASRGIGLEFTTQLLARGDTVIATARAPPNSTPSPLVESGSASKLWPLTGTPNGRNLHILECDVSDENSVEEFVAQVGRLGRSGSVLEKGLIDYIVLNAGVLEYPNRISEITFTAFAHHLHTNTIGPLFTAQKLLSLSTSVPSPGSVASANPIDMNTIIFISSDSGSAQDFRSFEDGFGAYSVSKAALNQGLRHLAAELHRKTKHGVEKKRVILALHPGEVITDMAANVTPDWDIHGIIGVEESVGCMLKVIQEKGFGGEDEGGTVSSAKEGRKREDGEASFWTWEGNRYPW